MNLFDRIIKLLNEAEEIKRDHDLIVDISTYNNSVHLSTYDAEGLIGFLDLANERKVSIEKLAGNGDLSYPFEGYFTERGVKFFVLLNQDEKEELEKLINEREADKFIDELGAL